MIDARPLNRRAYLDRFGYPAGSRPRGPKDAVPATTRCLPWSYCARFSGCAMALTSCRAESRGSWVSVSRVITYFTCNSTAVPPTTRETGHASRRAEVNRSALSRLLVTHPAALQRIPLRGR
jgi:hypothetical protein